MKRFFLIVGVSYLVSFVISGLAHTQQRPPKNTGSPSSGNSMLIQQSMSKKTQVESTFSNVAKANSQTQQRLINNIKN